ncbi:glyoxalase/Bleomycin resistance protein/Dioxygenase [Colletotrichum phormii]|uniref:Glyoxalase/Bleomycin resistance protein/Dioxygenase n=1 Tax=Colletotrichum phormii TaxID=359342 RepID=A0AAJ0E7J3_9PEZI|nr:glyoxalase/Bleomycin resistance protein/Dioxygenase [Colletotrichum phormii]KAK1621794.1 glyoxalase/Bleomycin resistance protein/Dioxygenase [Colletotrichum phormii]
MAITASTGICKPSELAHLVLRTANPDKLISFYQTFLNAKITASSPLITFLTWDHEHHRLAILNDPTAVPRQDNAVGVDHFALTFDSLGDLLQSYKARKDMGIEPVWCVNHGMSTSMYYRDPDGGKVETQVDAFETKEDAIAYMLSAEFGDDPRGARFDPEEMVKRFEAGEDEKSLMKRSAFAKEEMSF